MKNFKSIEAPQSWHLIDANGAILGRMSTQIATLLQGKHKPSYERHLDRGDFVVVINSAKLAVTGDKIQQKTYYRHTGYPGGLKSCNLKQMMEKKPAEVLRLAVKNMLPKGPLGRQMLSKLKIYEGAEHPHQAQNPIGLNITSGDKHD